MKILIVEDEEALAKGLKFNFEQEGYEVETTGDGHRALELFDAASPPFDLIVMDLMLPGMSGYETTREIRDRDEQVSILVLSARTLSEDRAMAFDAGTDQYLAKPFALPELLSRVRNLTNRRQARSTVAADVSPKRAVPARFEFGDGIVVDFDRFELTVGTATHTLTTMELQLLRYFIEQESRVLSRDQIMENVWEDTAAFSTRSIDNFVMRLRRLIEPMPSAPRHFLSVRGTGYRFVANPEPGDRVSDSENF
ncbi:MAG: response regulator transcription factor [Rhodopirellula sp.]|nr:response regulator transcription factor [Rhodopirellula sp.]